MYEQLNVLADYGESIDMIAEMAKDKSMSGLEEKLLQIYYYVKQGKYGEAAKKWDFNFEDVKKDGFAGKVRILFSSDFDFEKFVDGMCFAAACDGLCSECGSCGGDECCGCVCLLSCCMCDSACCSGGFSDWCLGLL